MDESNVLPTFLPEFPIKNNTCTPNLSKNSLAIAKYSLL